VSVPPPLQSQIDRIRHEIQEYGESTVGCEDLSVLGPNAVLQSSKWDAIATIAQREGWSFTYFPDGSVGFAKL
jgi:hypothetical protein